MTNSQDQLSSVATKLNEIWNSRFEDFLRESVTSYLGIADWTFEQIKDRISLLEATGGPSAAFRNVTLFIDGVPISRIVAHITTADGKLSAHVTILPATGNSDW